MFIMLKVQNCKGHTFKAIYFLDFRLPDRFAPLAIKYLISLIDLIVIVMKQEHTAIVLCLCCILANLRLMFNYKHLSNTIFTSVQTHCHSIWLHCLIVLIFLVLSNTSAGLELLFRSMFFKPHDSQNMYVCGYSTFLIYSKP